MSNKLYQSIVWPPDYSGLAAMDDCVCADVVRGQQYGTEEGRARNEGETSYDGLESGSGEVIQ
jgi:hypothetical protein